MSVIKITKENSEQYYNPDRELYLHWAIINEETIRFCNCATLKTFLFVFENDGERLYNHFKNDCDGVYQKFRTYLTQEQTNILILSIHINQEQLLYCL